MYIKYCTGYTCGGNTLRACIPGFSQEIIRGYKGKPGAHSTPNRVCVGLRVVWEEGERRKTEEPPNTLDTSPDQFDSPRVVKFTVTPVNPDVPNIIRTTIC